MNLPRLSSFIHIDQSSSSCLQLLPRVEEKQTGLGRHSVIIPSPTGLGSAWGFINQSFWIVEEWPWQPQKKEFFSLSQGCFLFFSLFFFVFISLEDLQWTEQLQSAAVTTNCESGPHHSSPLPVLSASPSPAALPWSRFWDSGHEHPFLQWFVLGFWLKTPGSCFCLDSYSVSWAAGGRDHFDVRLLVAGHVLEIGGCSWLLHQNEIVRGRASGCGSKWSPRKLPSPQGLCSVEPCGSISRSSSRGEGEQRLQLSPCQWLSKQWFQNSRSPNGSILCSDLFVLYSGFLFFPLWNSCVVNKMKWLLFN